MARSTGIILTAGGISFANDWVQADEGTQAKGGNLKIIVATLGAALVLGGVEKVSETAGVGLAWIVLVTVLVLPQPNRTAPLQTLARYGTQKK